MAKKVTYKSAGVDIEKAERSLKRLKEHIQSTHTERVLSDVGLFGGFYDLSDYPCRKPVLVSSTDGVGTKLKIAMLTGRHDTIGQDLVHHCINDIAVCGATPLFFLDYFASGRLETGVYEDVMKGIIIACKEAGIPLIGGETAEMPDFYQPGDYDLCGTIVGIVDKEHIIDGSKIEKGDVFIGVSCNGLHTNGYTLARKVLLSRFSLDESLPELGIPLGEELLKIHPNYYPLISHIITQYSVHGIAHITGGGLVKNIDRLLPGDLSVDIHWGSWEIPPIFTLIQEAGNVPQADMRQTFNMGIGLVFVVTREDADALLAINAQFEHSFYKIGQVI